MHPEIGARLPPIPPRCARSRARPGVFRARRGRFFCNRSRLWAPKGTPRNAIAKLNVAVVGALADPAVRRRIADQGMEIAPPEQQTPEAFRAIHRAEIEKWWPIIKAAGIKGE